MFNRKPATTPPTGPCKQLDVDICLALTGKTIGTRRVDELRLEADAADATNAAQDAGDTAQWLMIPTSKVAMKAWVRQVQSRVVQVSETVKSRVAEAGAQMGARMTDSSAPASRRKAG